MRLVDVALAKSTGQAKLVCGVRGAPVAARATGFVCARRGDVARSHADADSRELARRVRCAGLRGQSWRGAWRPRAFSASAGGVRAG